MYLIITTMGIITIIKLCSSENKKKFNQKLSILTTIFFIITIIQITFQLVRAVYFCFQLKNTPLLMEFTSGILNFLYALHYILFLYITFSRLWYAMCIHNLLQYIYTIFLVKHLKVQHLLYETVLIFYAILLYLCYLYWDVFFGFCMLNILH